MKEDINLLKQDRAERKATEEKLINEIVELKNETTSAEFEREEKKIRVDSMDKETWGKASQAGRTELIRKTINECFNNLALSSKIHIWITKPGRTMLPWARVSFPSSEHKYTYEKFVKDKRIFLINSREKIKYHHTKTSSTKLSTNQERDDQAGPDQARLRLGTISHLSGSNL